MKGQEVADLLGAFARQEIRVWVAGGWAVDVVVGRQTRAHGDLDLAVDVNALTELVALLGELGFSVTVDWLPSRIALSSAPCGCARTSGWLASASTDMTRRRETGSRGSSGT